MIYQKLDSKQLELIKKIENITSTDYELLGDFIQTDLLIYVIEDMFYEYEDLQEKYKDYKQYVKDNYNLVSSAEQFNVSDSDFI